MPSRKLRGTAAWGLSVYCRIRPNQPSEAAIGTDSPIKPNKIKSVLKSIRLNRFVFDLFV